MLRLLLIFLFFLPFQANVSGKEKIKKNAEALTKELPVPSLSTEEQQRFDYYFSEAIQQKITGKLDVAFELLQHCLAINPHSAVVHHEIMQYYMVLNNTAMAQRELELSVEEEPGNYWYSNTLMNLYLQQKNMDKAIALMEDMTKRFPNKLDIYYGLMDLYTSQELWDKEIQLLDKLEKKIGKSEQLSMQKFHIYMSVNDQKRAFKEIEGLIKEYPNNLQYRVSLGDAYLDANKADKALAEYQNVLAKEPDNVLAMYSMVAYYQHENMKDKMEEQLDTLILSKKVPDDIRLHVMQQFVMSQQGEGGDSLKIINRFEKIMAQEPDDPQLPMLYAQYLLSKGMQEKATPVLRQILDLTPDNATVRLTLLQNAIKREDYTDIINICEGGVLSNPDRMEFYFYLAIGYNHEERFDDALNICQKALTKVTDETSKELISDFYAIIGDILHSQNKKEEAYKAYDAALKNNPNNIGALNNYAYYLSVERVRLDQAEEMSYKTVKAEPTNATYLDTYAWILYEKEKYTEAKIYIDEAIKNLKDDSNVVLEHCGDIYYRSGDVEGALRFWQKAAEKGEPSAELKAKIKNKSMK